MSRYAKERHSYVCKDLSEEFNKFDKKIDERVKTLKGVDTATGHPYSFEVGYERFLGPELFFKPEIFSTQFTTPLPDLVDASIQSSPIDSRRGLYKTITLSGGSTMFPKFDKRLQLDLSNIVQGRMEAMKERFAKQGKEVSSEPIDVNVLTSPYQRYAVWYGGSKMAAHPDFATHCYTKAEYEEHGPKRFYSFL
ncbi:hypothetical protein GEMRC1_000393 [Eukaryota sp. GEM-RC1]